MQGLTKCDDLCTELSNIMKEKKWGEEKEYKKRKFFKVLLRF